MNVLNFEEGNSSQLHERERERERERSWCKGEVALNKVAFKISTTIRQRRLETLIQQGTRIVKELLTGTNLELLMSLFIFIYLFIYIWIGHMNMMVAWHEGKKWSGKRGEYNTMSA